MKHIMSVYRVHLYAHIRVHPYAHILLFLIISVCNAHLCGDERILTNCLNQNYYCAWCKSTSTCVEYSPCTNTTSCTDFIPAVTSCTHQHNSSDDFVINFTAVVLIIALFIGVGVMLERYECTEPQSIARWVCTIFWGGVVGTCLGVFLTFFNDTHRYVSVVSWIIFIVILSAAGVFMLFVCLRHIIQSRSNKIHAEAQPPVSVTVVRQ